MMPLNHSKIKRVNKETTIFFDYLQKLYTHSHGNIRLFFVCVCECVCTTSTKYCRYYINKQKKRNIVIERV